MASKDEEEVRPLRLEGLEPDGHRHGTHRVKAVAVALILCLAGGTLAWKNMMHCKHRTHGTAGIQGLFTSDVDAQMALKVAGLKSIKNRSLADGIVMKAMKSAGEDYAKRYDAHQVRQLPTSPVDAARNMLSVAEIKAYRAQKKEDRLTEAGHAFCAFNVLEAFISVMGMGDDINAIIRTCPPPRDGESELACQVNGGILVAWVGNLAAKLSFAASNCALTTNVNALCAVGVTGLVSAMGELAATASLAAATCVSTPPSLTTTKISVLGDQTVRGMGRRLLIGEGAIGNGIQCGLDVGMVVSNIANMGLAINSAVNSGQCGWQAKASPLNKVTGIPEALCTVDIGGAVAYIGQVVTFLNLIVVHCSDFLDVSALCGASVAGITTAAAAIAPYGAAMHAACRQNHIAKHPKIQEKINGLYDVPSVPRRLGELRDAMASVREIRSRLEGELGFNASAARGDAFSEGNMETLLRLMGESGETSSGLWPFSQCEA
ncbi:unnamed protein product [Symbiodinium natans]|uniref:Uncharacterized protein n=1 Tax=Symbiodinium natans TaxID=878477 RepID=A0A812V2N9_9DINO|nr:unnamed protein product [Symbiodinium natans]